jgi:hypothetical protein
LAPKENDVSAALRMAFRVRPTVAVKLGRVALVLLIGMGEILEAYHGHQSRMNNARRSSAAFSFWPH